VPETPTKAKKGFPIIFRVRAEKVCGRRNPSALKPFPSLPITMMNPRYMGLNLPCVSKMVSKIETLCEMGAFAALHDPLMAK